MPRTLTPEELESVRLTEAAEALEAEKRARTALQPTEGQLKLYHPHKDSLTYGQVSLMQNGPETTDAMIVFGGVEPGVAIVRAGHPLLPGLLRRHPAIRVMEPGERLGGTYLCDADGCDAEFDTKRALRSHRASHRSKARSASRATAAPADPGMDDQAEPLEG